MTRTRVKICGLTQAEHAWHAASAGADALGMVFYPPSARYIEPALAGKIVRELPAFVSTVALFSDADAEFVRAHIEQMRPDLLQFHGDETADYCRRFGLPYIKAVRVQAGLDLIQYAAGFPDARGLLLDTYVAGEAGGTGKAFDWSMIPSSLPLPLILSGGLNSVNVAGAIAQTRPWAVDVSSGVEIAKGIKDATMVEQFISEVNNASR
ncbi:MAG TPA: phosphoribosylanthranilate isomerase [Burkholderiales bacterium]|nr:phosphoribosylanthranilate isomerase [Burkholderiales bacterium]